MSAGSMNKRKPRPPCRCEAYKFPHRYGGGTCYGPEDDRERARSEERAERWLTRMVQHPRRVEQMMDDPRHGQAAGLNNLRRVV